MNYTCAQKLTNLILPARNQKNKTRNVPADGESSVIPSLAPRRKVWLTMAAGVPCSNDANRRTQDLDAK